VRNAYKRHKHTLAIWRRGLAYECPSGRKDKQGFILVVDLRAVVPTTLDIISLTSPGDVGEQTLVANLRPTSACWISSSVTMLSDPSIVLREDRAYEIPASVDALRFRPVRGARTAPHADGAERDSWRPSKPSGRGAPSTAERVLGKGELGSRP
jgi:hypothetical protein